MVFLILINSVIQSKIKQLKEKYPKLMKFVCYQAITTLVGFIAALYFKFFASEKVAVTISNFY